MIDGGIHTLIVEKQLEMRRKYKMNIRISDIVAAIIQNGVGNMDEFLCLGKEEECLKKDKSDIMNMANDIGIDIMYVKENMDNLAEIPCICGVYIITNKSGKIYIGASVDVHSRMTYNGSVERTISSVSIYATRNKSDAYTLEQYLIRKLNPGLNRQKPRIFGRGAAKTVPVEDGVHDLIIDKQGYILEKYRINIAVSQIIDTLLKNYVYKIEELFNIKV